MRLLLLQEKYLELLEGGHEIEALHCLRHELAPVPLHHSDKQLQLLTSYMMYSDKELLRKAADWPGLRGGAREQLMDKLQGLWWGVWGWSMCDFVVRSLVMGHSFLVEVLHVTDLSLSSFPCSLSLLPSPLPL